MEHIELFTIQLTVFFPQPTTIYLFIFTLARHQIPDEPRFYFQHEAFKVNCHDVSRQTRKVTALHLSFTTCFR